MKNDYPWRKPYKCVACGQQYHDDNHHCAQAFENRSYGQRHREDLTEEREPLFGSRLELGFAMLDDECYDDGDNSNEHLRPRHRGWR